MYTICHGVLTALGMGNYLLNFGDAGAGVHPVKHNDESADRKIYYSFSFGIAFSDPGILLYFPQREWDFGMAQRLRHKCALRGYASLQKLPRAHISDLY